MAFSISRAGFHQGGAAIAEARAGALAQFFHQLRRDIYLLVTVFVFIVSNKPFDL